MSTDFWIIFLTGFAVGAAFWATLIAPMVNRKLRRDMLYHQGVSWVLHLWIEKGVALSIIRQSIKNWAPEFDRGAYATLDAIEKRLRLADEEMKNAQKSGRTR